MNTAPVFIHLMMTKLIKIFFTTGAVVLILVACLSGRSSNSSAPMSAVTLTVIDEPGFYIPPDFTGLSFETDAQLPNHRRVKGYFFGSFNKQAVILFQNSAIRNLRIGGSTVDRIHHAAYNRAAIDSTFSFARAVGIKVIYSLPLLNAEPDSVAATALYIWTKYGDLLDSFSIGNEPNCPPYKLVPVGAIHTYDEYFPIWKRLAEAVISAVPEAKFNGPDSGGWQYTEEFARDTQDSAKALFITHHQYPNGQPFLADRKTRIPADIAISRMLSPDMLTGEYTKLHGFTCARIQPYGYRSRMTESNDYLGGIDGASNAMSSALWALDYMHWQAFRGLAGINFHNNQWLKTCTVTMDETTGEYFANPKAHAIRAFDMVTGGWTMPVDIVNPDTVNLTAYAVKGDDYLYVTIVNKEHSYNGQEACQADVTISAKGFTKGRAEAMYLVAPGNDAGAMNGITLGGDSITNFRPWQGGWTPVKKKGGQYRVNVVESSAVVVKIPVK
jgi:hypothetical protein